jgi:predicted DNA-binding transcriptional regulator AlpA
MMHWPRPAREPPSTMSVQPRVLSLVSSRVPRFLGFPHCADLSKTGLSRASIYRYLARNWFPARRRIGPGRVAWLASEVVAWMETRPGVLCRPGLIMCAPWRQAVTADECANSWICSRRRRSIRSSVRKLCPTTIPAGYAARFKERALAKSKSHSARPSHPRARGA